MERLLSKKKYTDVEATYYISVHIMRPCLRRVAAAEAMGSGSDVDDKLSKLNLSPPAAAATGAKADIDLLTFLKAEQTQLPAAAAAVSQADRPQLSPSGKLF
jgi:hypothetical protein